MARLGSFDELMQEVKQQCSGEVLDTARALRELVFDGLPDAHEVVRLAEKTATYGVGEKKMSECHVYIRPAAGHVNLGFWHGVDLPDPDGLLEGTGKRMRHIKLRSVEEAKSPAIARLVEAALAERRSALGLN